MRRKLRDNTSRMYDNKNMTLGLQFTLPSFISLTFGGSAALVNDLISPVNYPSVCDHRHCNIKWNGQSNSVHLPIFGKEYDL